MTGDHHSNDYVESESESNPEGIRFSHNYEDVNYYATVLDHLPHSATNGKTIPSSPEAPNCVSDNQAKGKTTL